ncbi:D-3-phosphoglycerate dehydrogenase [Variovorax boronicumulans]|uniref:D-3-phosphoglycerate dehydrogenase n=1 Tax=Variovorax boronicumulans TaxID=436515 RepID=A0AAW8CVR8_9BURK|nr:NAD(P)-dependent oxidoreductase [Variovorax boronicumulans]MDP9895528.1 D-3-phosphoglycerate dehydrogenase [Variovorax boronicumulans]MDQ0055764.1 D-3-phosphoglycerate dehydrogenase [Variovorax boronicumulans]
MITVFVSHPQSKLAPYFGDRAIAALQAIAQVRFNPTDHELSSGELAGLAQGCDAIISYRQTVGDEALFAALPDLKAFVRCAIDIRNIDVASASRHGVLVTQASAGFIASVSEWVVGAMIDLGRHISASTALYHAGQPVVPAMGRELRGSTLGVIGYGQISRYLCDVGLALGMHIVVHDPYASIDRAGLEQVALDALLARSDFVVCLAPATEATENLMNAAAFAAMRPQAFFINASRGDLVDEDALLAALDAGTIAGCALDVGRAPDQMPSPRVAAHPRVIATPHIGGLTPPAVEHQAMETVGQLGELFQGRMPKGAVNAAEAWRWRKAFG